MYLIGKFERSEYIDENPMYTVKYVEKITREDLIKCKEDECFQVINILDKKYYDPKQNAWVGITIA